MTLAVPLANPPDVDDPASNKARPPAPLSVPHVASSPSMHPNNKRATWRDDFFDDDDANPPSAPNNSGSSSSSSTSSSLDEAAAPPDGGWGWVVVAASFMVNLIADGITLSFGVIYLDFLDKFDAGKGSTMWIGSLFMAMPLLCGPIASFATDRYGCRKVTMFGAVLAAAGFVLSSQCNSMLLLLVTFGIAGFGLALCYVAAVVIVAYWFERRRSLATGISQCGSGIGTFIFAPLTQFLLSKYGWQGTSFILAGCFLNLAVCGALMRDVRPQSRQRKRLSSETEKSTAPPAELPNPDELRQLLENGGEEANRLCSSLVALPTFVKSGEKVPLEALQRLAAQRPMYDVLVQNYPGLLMSHSMSAGGSKEDTALAIPENTLAPPQNSHHPRKLHSAFLKDLRVHRHSLTYRGAMLNINRYRLRASSCPDIYRNSMTTIDEEKDTWYSGLAEIKSVMLDILDFSYFTDLRFTLFTLSNFLLYLWYDVPYVYLADYAKELGFAENKASMLISVIGLLNMVGEIVLGWVGDKTWISANHVYAICMVICGAATALIPLFTDYNIIAVIAGVFGLFIGANYSLTSIIVVELITLDKFTNGYGLLLLIQGIANLVGPPLAGWIYDITGNYDLSFYLGGFFIAVSGVLLMILPFVETVKNHKSKSRKEKKTVMQVNGKKPTQIITPTTEKEAMKAANV
ncbi:monocarboxylate transporter 9-like isoform X2 [Neocloeon triangulifer]|uniref:monocarboxylate transporter 9-like isoform X2 n=1 Tax=Neocloeon triangulifer TaxID=2078957 RepID=UPI00286F07C5|nr:monocarboxylate transporter 9-like isoform X2 [Neocloeon triangulifer]